MRRKSARLRPRHPSIRLSVEELESRFAPATLVDAYTVTYQDTDGDSVLVKASLPVFVDQATANAVFQFDQGSVNQDNSLKQQLQTLSLTSLNHTVADGMSLSVTVQGPPVGNSLANVGYIDSTNLDLGDVVIQGDLGRIFTGDDVASAANVNSLTVQSMGKYGTSTQAAGGGLVSYIPYTLGSLDVAGDVDQAEIHAGAFGSVTIGGSLIGGAADNSGYILASNRYSLGDAIGPVSIGGSIEGGGGASSGGIFATGYITSVTIGGSLLGSTGGSSGVINSDGGIGPVQITGSITGGGGGDSGKVTSEGDIGNVSASALTGGAGFDTGVISADGALGNVHIGGDVQSGSGGQSARILNNTGNMGNLTIDGSLIGGAQANSGWISSAGQIGAIQIGGSWEGGAGANSGYINSGGYISSISVGGSMLGGDGGASGAVDSSGGIGDLTIGGDLKAGNGGYSGRVRTQGDIGNISIGAVAGGSIVGGATQSGMIAADGSIGTIHVYGDLVGGSGDYSGRIQSADQNIAGVTLDGSLIGGTGNDTGTIIASGTLGPVSIGGGIAGGNNPGATSIDESGYILASQIGDVSVGGSVTGGTINDSGEIITTGSLGNVAIGGALTGGSISGTASLTNSGYIQGGSIGSLSIGTNLASGTNTSTGTLANSGAIRSGNDIGPITITGDVVGNSGNDVIISARGQASPAPGVDLAIQGLTVHGSVTDAMILAGYYLNGIGVNPDAQIGDVSVDHDWTASTIAAGSGTGPDGLYGTVDDVSLSGSDSPSTISMIADITIGGVVTGTASGGDHFGFIAQEIGGLSVDGSVIPLIPGPGNDDVPLGPTGDVDLHELAALPGVVFKSDFNSPASSLPNPPWNTVLGGGFTINHSNQAVSAALVQGLYKAATVDNLALTDVSISADVGLNPAPANGLSAAAVIVRSQDTNDVNNCYFAALTPAPGGLDQILIEKVINGQIFGIAAKALRAGITSGNLTLDVYGNTLTAYLNGQLEVIGTDATYSGPGGFGIGSQDAGATFANVVVSSLVTPAMPFSDKFTRANSNTLGDPWYVNAFLPLNSTTVPGGGFGINGSNQAVSLTAGLNVASIFGLNFTSSTNVSATVVSAGAAAGLVANWNSDAQSGYALLLSGTSLQLFTVVNGALTPLGTAQTISNNNGTLGLQVSGGSLSVFYNSNFVFSVTDSTFTSGSAGLATIGAGSTFSSFNLSGS